MNELVNLYCRLVKSGKLTIDEVPVKYREKVKEKLKEA